MKSLLERIAEVDAGVMLDAGCGDGETARRIVEAVGAVERLVLLDIDAAALDEARDQFEGVADRLEVEFGIADVTQLPFAAGSFDTVLLSDVLHHSGDPQRALAECARVLKPAGILLFSEMVCDELSASEAVGRDLHHFKSAIDRLCGVPHQITLQRLVIERALASAGFETVWWQRERFDPAHPADPDGRRRIAAREQFLETYLEHAEQLPQYATLRKQAAFLKYRMLCRGFTDAPELRLIARKLEI